VDGYCCADASCMSSPVDCVTSRLCELVGAAACDPNGANCTDGGLGGCACDAAGCRGATQWLSKPLVHTLDLSLRDGEGEGSIGLEVSGANRLMYNVRLTRVGPSSAAASVLRTHPPANGSQDVDHPVLSRKQMPLREVRPPSFATVSSMMRSRLADEIPANRLDASNLIRSRAGRPVAGSPGMIVRRDKRQEPR